MTLKDVHFLGKYQKCVLSFWVSSTLIMWLTLESQLDSLRHKQPLHLVRSSRETEKLYRKKWRLSIRLLQTPSSCSRIDRLCLSKPLFGILSFCLPSTLLPCLCLAISIGSFTVGSVLWSLRPPWMYLQLLSNFSYLLYCTDSPFGSRQSPSSEDKK